MTPPVPQLDKIWLAQWFFRDCIIADNPQAPLQPDQLAGYRTFTAMEPRMDRANRLIVLTAHVVSEAVGHQEQLLGASATFKVELGFHVEDLEAQLVLRDGFPEPLPTNDLSLTLVSVAYSTLRGLLVAKTANTIFEGMTLPVMNAVQLMADSLKMLNQSQETNSGTSVPPKRPGRPRKPRPAVN